MKKHEKEIMQSQLDAEKAVLKELEKNYEQAIKDIDEKVAALLGRQDADMQHVIYQVEYQRQLRAQAQAILDQLHANEFETISEYLAQCYEEGFMGSLYSMQQQGVPLAFPINQEQVVMALQTESKISEGLYTRLGKDVGELKKNISSEIARGISTSMPYAQIAKNINRQAEIGLNRAMRIARTEGGRIQNKAAMDTMMKAKEMGADVVKRWSAALDARTRDSHARIDGEIREVGEKFSNGLMYPKDPSGKASEVVNCRCKVQEKARWALTANQTKMLGDVSQMSDSQKEAIADRLGIPVKDIDKYSGQIVPINAKNYADFKKQYKGIWNYDNSDAKKKSSPNQRKAVEKTAKISTIKSITVDDVVNATSGGSVQKEVATHIATVLENHNGLRLFNKTVSKKLGEHIVFQTDPQKAGTFFDVVLVLNEDVLGGKTVAEIDALFANATNTVANSLEDGLVHEMYHSKLIRPLNYAELESLYDEMDNVHIDGLGKTAKTDGTECIAEVGVLIERGEKDKVPKEALELFERFFKND